MPTILLRLPIGGAEGAGFVASLENAKDLLVPIVVPAKRAEPLSPLLFSSTAMTRFPELAEYGNGVGRLMVIHPGIV